MSKTSLDLGFLTRKNRLIADVEAGVTTSRVRLITEGLDGTATADATLLEHILSNLLSNALKYSPGDSLVDFTVTRRGTSAEFVIRDRGCGIPKPDHARLFAAFHRGSNVSQTPGSGLGLVIVKRCVESHGGTLHFDSAEGRGTTFTVALLKNRTGRCSPW